MSVFYVVAFGLLALFGASAVYGLVWAVRTGQLREFGRGATSIFDEEEPVGRMTDRFPTEDGREERDRREEEAR